jgi:hypothetical protein
MKKTPREALEVGDIYYFTGKACVNGHISKRLTLGGKCVECREQMRFMRKQKHVGFMKVYNKNMNDKTRKTAGNAFQKWSEKDIKMVTEKDQHGHYVIKQLDASLKTGRSLASIRNVRARYRRPVAELSECGRITPCGRERCQCKSKKG